MGEKRNAYRSWWEKPEGNRSLESLQCRLDDNIKMNLRDIGLGWYELD
jgi:hypothetical protein